MLMISAKDWSSTPPKRDVETSYSGMITYINEVTFSTEISVPKEDVDDYRDILQQEKWYQDRLKDNMLTDADRLQLKKQYESLLDWEDKTYGRFDEYVPRPGNWTDDGYADVSGIVDSVELGSAISLVLPNLRCRRRKTGAVRVYIADTVSHPPLLITCRGIPNRW